MPPTKRKAATRYPSNEFYVQVPFKSAEQKAMIEHAAAKHGLATATFSRVILVRIAKEVLAADELLKSIAVELPSLEE